MRCFKESFFDSVNHLISDFEVFFWNLLVFVNLFDQLLDMSQFGLSFIAGEIYCHLGVHLHHVHESFFLLGLNLLTIFFKFCLILLFKFCLCFCLSWWWSFLLIYDWLGDFDLFLLLGLWRFNKLFDLLFRFNAIDHHLLFHFFFNLIFIFFFTFKRGT